MERHNLGRDRLIVPTDFTSPATSGTVQNDLVPPSHFASSVPFAGPHRAVQNPGATPTISWVSPVVASVPSGDPSPASPWLAISQAQQEILELRKENQRLMMLQGDSIRGRIPVDDLSGPRTRCVERSEQWSRWESEWRQEAEKHKAEAERLKRQVEALKDTAGSHREEMRDRDCTVNRQSHELETMHEELCKAKTELRQIREELIHSSAQKEKISSQLQQLNASHSAELTAARKTNSELQDRLQSMTSEVLQLKSTLVEVSTERDGLREHLSQMGQAFETQSATLHSLRNYIGQLAPEKGEKERLNDTVERLNKEKAALQMTTELLTVRLKSVNEILALQEEKMVKKISTDPLVKNGCEGLKVLQLWREKVFKLCVQLRSKDIELRGEKDHLLSRVRSMEQQLQQEQHRASLLQHSLDDRIAELDLERVEKETLKQDLVQVHKENSQLKSQNQKAETELKTITEAVHRFSLAFESKVAQVDAAQTKLVTLTQRLTFAKRRVETIQGLIMRRAALQKVQWASKQTEQAAESITNLKTELSLVCEERDKLTQELKRTPELIEKTLADLKEKYESNLRQQQQELEQSWMEVRQAVAGREEAEQSLQQIQAQLEESKYNLEKLRSELLSQQEHSERALQERMSEIKDRCAEELREMEVQVNTAKREHTKAVMTLRQFEREAARKQEEMTKGRHTKREVKKTHLKETEKDKNLLLASVAERGLTSEYTRAHTAALQNFVAPRETPSERSCPVGTKVQLPADEKLLSVLEELHSLSAVVVNSSEDSAEEEGQSDSVGPSTQAVHTADT
ncbi:coiled-coil alpha-helical rod protein 1 isoform 2-T3 [Acanthopagrus schlegelii]